LGIQPLFLLIGDVIFVNLASLLKSNLSETFEIDDCSRVDVSCMIGCKYDCKYCHAKEDAIRRRRKTAENWSREELNQAMLYQKYNKVPGTFVFPAGHDIHPENVNEVSIVLFQILSAGNKVVVTTKPNYESVQKICSQFFKYKSQILFQFSIGSVNSETLEFWEPGAPDFNERLKSLKIAFYQGFNTSVVCEPVLDTGVEELIEAVSPYVTEHIMIGDIRPLLSTLKRSKFFNEELIIRVQQLLNWNTNERLLDLHNRFKDNDLIRWNGNMHNFFKTYRNSLSA
jgi:DNA repair photolyase